MRRLLQILFTKPLTWLANRASSKPDRESVFKSLTHLLREHIRKPKQKRVAVIQVTNQRFIVFSDQHKGNRDQGDDFVHSEKNYLAALRHYNQKHFHFINLGDSEELWKYKAHEVIPAYRETFEAESAFHPGRYFKTFGNHDLIWKNKWDTESLLKNYFKLPLPVYEAVLLNHTVQSKSLSILLTHGHQGDKLSDNNSFSTWIVAHIWAPIQRYLQLKVNTPSKDDTLKHKHNKIMYSWSCNRKNLLLITGHTHNPVFASGKYSDHPSNRIEDTLDKRPTYFNTGCCCFSDGDITGIEIEESFIRLIKWYDDAGVSRRKVLEEASLQKVLEDLT